MNENKTEEHVHECEWPSHKGDKVDFGCKCACGAVRHLIGWQTVKVLDPVSPFTQYEYRVVVPGGRGGRADGVLYEGRDLDTVKYWLREREKDSPWVERRPVVPWERVEDL